MDAFPGSTIEYYDDSTTRQSKGVSVTAKADPKLFDDPDGIAPSRNLGDYDNRLVLILPLEEGMLSTTFGNSDVIWSDVMVLNPAGPHDRDPLVWLPNTPIFWKGVHKQINAKVGKGRWVAGRLKQLSRKDKAWALQDLQPSERDLLAEVMNSPQFEELINSPRPERKIPEDPF